MAVNLRYTFYSSSYKSSQFSHKQLVLVATPVSTGVYFFIYLHIQKTEPRAAPAPSAIISVISKDLSVIKYNCTNSMMIPYTRQKTPMMIKVFLSC